MQLVKDTFTKEFIKAIASEYYEHIKEVSLNIHAEEYFNNAGEYGFTHKSRLDHYTSEDTQEFQNLLFPCNIDILQYVLENRNTFQNLQFLDNGSGFGILAAFLKKINIKCYSYDNLRQLPEVPNFDKKINDIVEIDPVRSDVPDNWLEDVNVLTTSSAFCTQRRFLEFKNLKYILMDKLRIEDGIVPELIKTYNFKVLKELPETIVYGE